MPPFLVRSGLGLPSSPSDPSASGHVPAASKSVCPIVNLLVSMATSDPPTTITIRSSTRQLLEGLKRPGESYDALLQELAEEYYSEATLAELRRRVAAIRSGKATTIPAKLAYKRLGV